MTIVLLVYDAEKISKETIEDVANTFEELDVKAITVPVIGPEKPLEAIAVKAV